MKVSKDVVNQRRLSIMKMIEENTYVSVEDLAEAFKVSLVTVRRDLEYWEEKGAIERNYGGASLIQAFVEDDNYEKTRHMRAIAKKAASFIEDNDTVFINSSRTALMTVDFIKNKRVTIITNNARAINYSPDPAIKIIFTGGEVLYPKNSMSGDFAIAALNNITANKCIIGCSGVDSRGITTGYLQEMLVNQTMLRRTRDKRILLCDHTKLGLNYNFRYSDLNNITCLITDHEADDEILDEIRADHPIEIIKAEHSIEI